MELHKRSQLIKHKALELGFDSCGISKAEFLEEEATALESWLAKGMHGKMTYMENHFDKRLDPTKLVEEAKSVVSVTFNYFTTKKQLHEDAPKVSMYALGDDYHFVVKRKLKSLLQFIEKEIGEVHGRCFVDSAPVLDKAWAKKSGLGWVGKHTNLLAKNRGSYFFIAEIILDLELSYDVPVKDYCGNCTKCIDACPTQAIFKPYQLDGSKCLSYFTIELKDEVIPNEVQGKFENWIFGCDICQQVCPINSRAKEHSAPELEPTPKLLSMTKREWEEVSEEVFQNLFKKTALKRTGYIGLKRNLNFLKKSESQNSGHK